MYIRITLIALTTLNFCLTSFAQIPNYFPNGAQWRINSLEYPGEVPCWQKDEYVVDIAGDTMINGNTYKKLVQHGLTSQYFNGMPPAPNPSPCVPSHPFQDGYALIRQENKKIYIYDILENTDTLLYDFDLQLGDYLPASFNNQSALQYEVTGIDSILVAGDYRKQFTLIDHFGNGEINKLTEGIGHNLGFKGSMNPFEFFENEFICFAIGGTAFYPNLGAACDLNVSLSENILDDISLYPNPAVYCITLANLPAVLQKSKVMIQDISGRILMTSSIQASDKLNISISDLKPGSYFIVLENVQGSIPFQKQ